jgi:acetyltransferase-like isoleucine patch superfamily enzyme
VKIGVTIGGNSCIMPGASSIEDDAVLGDVSLVMKGKVVPGGSRCAGVPAVPHECDAPTLFA